jgi:hypothetical protein
MGSGTTATLDGFDLLNAAAVRWPQVDGVQPMKQVLYMEAGTAQKLWKKRTGNISDSVTLEVNAPGRPLWQAQQLYVLGLAPGPMPQILGVIVADQRVWWPYVTVALACNVPRRVGSKPLLAEGRQGIVEQLQIRDDLQYAPWSLEPKSRKAWTAMSMLTEVVGRVVRATSGGKSPSIASNLKRQLAVQGVQFVEPGHTAVQRVLSYVAGAAVSVRLDGTVAVRDARDGGEGALVKAGDPIFGGPLPFFADKRLVRPSSITVFFEREIELRLDSVNEETGQATGTTSLDNVNDYRGMENVGQVTDPLGLALPALGGLPAVTAPRDTWVNFPRLTRAWQASPVAFQKSLPSGFGLGLDIPSLRLWYCSSGLLQDIIQGIGSGSASWLLAARVDTALSNFRTAYRMPSKYLDRISRIYPYRASLLDPSTGTRAPASVYCDFARFFGVRGALEGDQKSFRFLWQNFTGFATDLSDATPAPFGVVVEDEQQGILRLQPRRDPFGRVARTVPGLVVGPDGTNPCSADPRDAGPGRPGIQSAYASLAAGFRCTVVLTVVPAAPNDETRFQAYSVEPKFAEAKLGIKLGPCVGPPLTIRIPPSVATARIPWLDSAADAVDAAMGVPGASGGTLPTPINEAQLQDVAAAVAAQLWAQDVDRWEGGITLPLDPSLQPAGNAGSISHALQSDGTAVTVVGLPPQPPPVDMLALLSEEARRITLGLIEQRGASGS